MNVIRAVFFDSGDTLAQPMGDGWWPKPKFKELVAGYGFAVPDDVRIRAALHAGMPDLSTRRRVSTLDEEIAEYVVFYELVMRNLFDEVPVQLVQDLAHAAVYVQDQRPFDDTLPTLRDLAHAGFGLGVVSNAGPSLELRHQDMGMRDFFDPFVISAVVGHEKPGRRIFEIALERASVKPEEVVFVDDIARNVKTAREMGMHAFVIDRAGGPGWRGTQNTIANLAQLREVLGLNDGVSQT